MHRPARVPSATALAVTVSFTLALALVACGDSAVDTTAGATDGTGEHDHALYELPDGVPVPTIQIDVEPDPVSGVNVHVEVTDFIVAPEHASTDAVAGEGHFHAYVDGQKVARFYNQSIHLPVVEGEHRVTVELSANDHSTYAVDGVPIAAGAEVAVPAPAEDNRHHDPIEAADPAPTIDLTVTPDPKSGWNVHAAVRNLAFAPRSAGMADVDGEGHLHLHVDGEKVARLYGEWWHLDPLPAGEHEISVEATANDHRPYVVDGDPVAATVTIEVTAEQAADASDDGHDTGDDAAGHEHDMTMTGSGELLDMAAADADTTIEIEVADGSVERDDNRFVVDEGSTVGLIVTTDATDHVHVHGYDILAMVGPNDPVELVFIADSGGVFEVELEDAGLFLFDLQVG